MTTHFNIDDIKISNVTNSSDTKETIITEDNAVPPNIFISIEDENQVQTSNSHNSEKMKETQQCDIKNDHQLPVSDSSIIVKLCDIKTANQPQISDSPIKENPETTQLSDSPIKETPETTQLSEVKTANQPQITEKMEETLISHSKNETSMQNNKSSNINVNNKSKRMKSKKSPKIAICFHFFYQDMFAQFAQYIDNVLRCSHPTDIYITYHMDSEIIDKVKRIYPNAVFIKCDRGCDTGAFLLQMKAMYESGKHYDYVFKFHTKKLPVWRAQLLEDIAGSPQIVKMVIDDFDFHKSVGMIGVNRWIMGNDPSNKLLVDQICRRLNIKVKQDSCFIAGTIFWIRYEIIRKLIEENHIDLDYEYNLCEIGYPNRCPSFTHSWERIFGILIYNYDYHIKGYKCNIDPCGVRANTVPPDFDWQAYIKLNSSIFRPFVENVDQCINCVTKILYGASPEESIDVTAKLKNYINNNAALDLMNFAITDYLGDPFPFIKKKMFIFRENSINPSIIINEYNGMVDKKSHSSIYKGRLYLSFTNDKPDDINKKIAINHYMNIGQYEKRPYKITN